MSAASEPERSMIHFVCQGLQHRLSQLFNISPPKLKLTTDGFAQLLAEGGGPRRDNPNVQYPLTYIRPTTIEENPDSYRSKFFARRGFASRIGLHNVNDQDAVIDEFNLVPVKIVFEFGYYTDDPLQFLDFSMRWMFESHAGGTNFVIRYHGVKMDIRVELEPSFEVPEKQAADDVQQGEATSLITVYAYTNGPVRQTNRRQLNPKPVFGGVELLRIPKGDT